MTPALLRANLCFIHGTMRASEGLLRAAITKSNDDELRAYFAEHLIEETGHLEMLETDLAALGVKGILEFPQAAQLAGAQYYYIEHEHPALLLGYMLALESNTPTVAQVDALEAQFGPLICVRHHAEHDPHHAAELQNQITLLEPRLMVRVLDNRNWTITELQRRIPPLIEQASQHFKVNT